MDLRGTIHPRHAGLPPRLPVNSNQARNFKEPPKDNNYSAKAITKQ
jgi:hypothetical protein